VGVVPAADRHGRFDMHLPAGRYTVSLALKGWPAPIQKIVTVRAGHVA
jgi:hypothetical protein